MLRRFVELICPFAPSSAYSGNFTWMAAIFFLGTYIVIGTCLFSSPVLYWLLGRNRLERLSDQLEGRLGRCLIVGIGTLAVTYALDTALSLMGSPGRIISVVVSALFWLMLVVGYTGVAVWVTSKARGEPPNFAWVALGAGLITILQVIPLVGPLFLVWFGLLASGSVVVTVFGIHQHAPRDGTSLNSSQSQPPSKTAS